jgi:hypothetical protein
MQVGNGGSWGELWEFVRKKKIPLSMGRHGGALEADETFIASQSSTFVTTIALRRK